MTRSVLCIHPDDALVADLVAAATETGDHVAGVTGLHDGEAAHARRPAEVVVTDVDQDAAVVRSLLRWHPAPAVVTVGDPRDADLALASGASDHVEVAAAAQDLPRAVDRAWRRHRAARTRRARLPAHADLPELRVRAEQVVALAVAARDLIGVEDLPQPTARSLLDQATQVSRSVVDLVTDGIDEQSREALDLAGLLDEVWPHPHRALLDIELDPVDVHGWAGPVRTALHVLAGHALRAPHVTSRVVADLEVLPWAVRLRLHDDGPDVPAARRRTLFVGGEDSPSLLPAHHVATRHGGAAWLADSDRAAGTMSVLELPLRSDRR